MWESLQLSLLEISLRTNVKGKIHSFPWIDKKNVAITPFYLCQFNFRLFFEVKLDNFPTREGIIQKLQLVVLAVGGARARPGQPCFSSHAAYAK
jgi:hypothetical protein